MQNPRRILFLFLTAIILLPGLRAAERFFPLSAGNFWEYETADGKHQFKVEVSLPVINGDRAYHYVRGYLTSRQLLRELPGQAVMIGDSETLTEKVSTSFDPAGLPIFPADYRPCGTVTGRVSAVREDFLTSTGYWNDVLRVNYDPAGCGGETLESEWFVPGVGMIRRTVRVNGALRTYDLVTARVGNSVIQAHMYTAASVSFYRPVEGDMILRFKVQVVGSIGAEPQFRFSTAQRYDLVIRDAQGRKLWQYSDGKIFPPEPFDIPEIPTYVVEVPLSELPGGTIPEGAYRADAWIVSQDGPPLAAAATTFVVGDFGQPPGGTTAVIRSKMRPGVSRPLPGRMVRY